MDDLLICPFCGEDDFDAVGLKHHLIKGHCETYDNIMSVEEFNKMQQIEQNMNKDLN